MYSRRSEFFKDYERNSGDSKCHYKNSHTADTSTRIRSRFLENQANPTSDSELEDHPLDAHAQSRLNSDSSFSALCPPYPRAFQISSSSALLQVRRLMMMLLELRFQTQLVAPAAFRGDVKLYYYRYPNERRQEIIELELERQEPRTGLVCRVGKRENFSRCTIANSRDMEQWLVVITINNDSDSNGIHGANGLAYGSWARWTNLELGVEAIDLKTSIPSSHFLPILLEAAKPGHFILRSIMLIVVLVLVLFVLPDDDSLESFDATEAKTVNVVMPSKEEISSKDD
ncbi:hypothetical protein K435DRAFT_791519 [Dendrothele bispora CBS 962.96]|uniref:Uncharacterized protein n=1 Tax=Dendrothele bispora (strain CBS 962.96) TaxID=1314807 RepID=A0A4S8MNC0_DENBC|nr:hypothetical protein K435DRAFT_791519 [Dendrothele bispora CBS 962.96]